MKEHDIKILIEKFMDGNTSVDEEHDLQKYFCETDNIPAEFEPFAAMFRYFAGGMPEKAGLLKETDGEKKCRKTSIKRYIGWAIGAAAAAVAAIIMFTLPHENSEKPIASLPTAPKTDSESTMQKVDSLENSVNNVDTSTTSGQEKRLPEKRKTIKYRYKPAPPETLLANKYEAQADSINKASQMMAEQELQRIEYLQQLTIGLIQAANVMRDEKISLMCSEEIY